MIIEFNVANYKSFKDRAVLSLVASSDNSLDDTNIINKDHRRLVKSSVIYGANASGKSNLLDAMWAMRHMVLTSSKDTQAGEDINVESFKLSTETEGNPSLFEVVFIHNNNSYRYGFEANKKKVISEWLFDVTGRREAQLFVRENSEIKVNSKRFKEGSGLEIKTRENALFLSVCAQWNGSTSKDILSWYRNIGFIQGSDDSTLGTTVEQLSDVKNKHWILEMTQLADLSISDLEGRIEKLTLESLPKDMPEELKKVIVSQDMSSVELKTYHKKFKAEGIEDGIVIFDLEDNESAGTQKYINLLGPLRDTLDAGKIIIIDELDARLHPLLTRAIITLFNSAANHKNAQLIFASHDTNLLSNKLFRRDQVWFTEKNQFGATNLYSLIELKGVRKEALFGKDYILGKYGAIPFIGDPTWLFCEDADE
ncbi:MAG: ATP-binding protein [Syntrophales bacterium]|jgi:hypothetical protein